MKNKKYLYCLVYIIIIGIVLFLLYFLLDDTHNYNKLTIKMKDLSYSINNILYYPFKKEPEENTSIGVEKESLEKEIKELKDELNLKETLVDNKIVNATTVKRSMNYWYNILTIDKGKKDGIKNGNIVMNKNGVIGKVIKANDNNSDVKLLTSKNKNNYISVMFSYENNNYYGLIDDYNYKKNELHLKNVVGDFTDILGVDVTTSGLSQNSVKGLLVGKIKRMKKTNYGISNDVYVTPSANFNNINIVSVLIR